jgi:predicted dehydrogenase
LRRTRLGLIGLGSMGKIHLQNCLKLQNAELAAVADVSKQALKHARDLGLKDTYEDYQELITKSNVDAVIIALPTQLHAECAKVASENHKHILLEKPLARDVTEGQEIVGAANKHNVKLMIGYPLRFSNTYLELKAKIDRGELGDIQIAYATNIGTGPFSHRSNVESPIPIPDWWWNKKLTGGGALLDLGSHMINYARWCFGDIVEAKSYLGYRLKLEQEDHAVCLLKFSHGQIGVLTLGWFSQNFHSGFEVHGTAGYASTAEPSQNKIKTAFRLLLRKTPTFNIPYFKEIQKFVDCIQKDEKPQLSGEDAMKDLKVIERAYANKLELS